MLIKGELGYIEMLRSRGDCHKDRLDEIEEALKRGEKFEEMWKKLRDIYLSDPKVDEGLLKRLMDGLEEKYFPNSRRQKINNLLEQLNSPGIQTNVKSLKNLLIELRDEEL